MIVSLLPLVYLALLAQPGAAKDSTSFKNTTGTSPILFPTDVGFGSDEVPGGAPYNAQIDKISYRPRTDASIEMRWLPKNAKRDHATSDDIFRHLANMTPYKPADKLFPETYGYEKVPDQCEIKQVHILHRHGSRYPDKGHKSGPGNFGEKVQDAVKAGKLKASGELEFLYNWNYDLGQKILVHNGAQEMFMSGVKAYYDYAKLLSNFTAHKPVVRTSSHSRVLDSARYWTLGFFGWDATDKMHLEVLTEDDFQNLTLAGKNACRNADSDDYELSVNVSAIWQNIYLQAPKARLQKNLKGIDLTITDVYNMMSACPYETVGIGYSDFCKLFTKNEWLNFEYDMDLQTMADNGFLNPTARGVGIGWVSEFLARLKKEKFTGPVTTQNMTLDTNSTYFPLDQPLFVDVSHHSQMTSIMTALNLTQFKSKFDPHHNDQNRNYKLSQVLPYGARWVWEVLDCKEKKGNQTYIRMKMNEAIVPLNEAQGCKSRPDGLCKLDDFTSYLEKNAYKASKFDLSCFGKNGTDFKLKGLSTVTDGVVPDSAIVHH